METFKITLPRPAAYALALAVDHIAEEARTAVRAGDSHAATAERMTRYTVTYGRLNATLAGDYDSAAPVTLPLPFADSNHAHTVLGILREYRDRVGERPTLAPLDRQTLDDAIGVIEAQCSAAVIRRAQQSGLGADTTISRGGGFR